MHFIVRRRARGFIHRRERERENIPYMSGFKWSLYIEADRDESRKTIVSSPRGVR